VKVRTSPVRDRRSTTEPPNQRIHLAARVANIAVPGIAIIEISIAILSSIAILIVCLVLHLVLQYF